MFKKREKKERKQLDVVPDDSKEEESVSDVVHEFKERARRRAAMIPTTRLADEFGGAETRDADNVPAFYDSQNHRDLGEYLGKRDPKENSEETLNQQLEKILNEGNAGGKLSEIFQNRKNAENLEEDFKKLGEIEQLSRKIKDTAKDRAYWSIGMIEVDVGMDRKIANIEATEAEKRSRLVQEYVKATASNNLKVGTQPVEQKTTPSDPITNWIWKPKDQGLSVKEREKRERVNMLKAFHQSGKVYKNKKLLGQLGINLDNLSNIKSDEEDDD